MWGGFCSLAYIQFTFAVNVFKKNVYQFLQGPSFFSIFYKKILNLNILSLLTHTHTRVFSRVRIQRSKKGNWNISKKYVF